MNCFIDKSKSLIIISSACLIFSCNNKSNNTEINNVLPIKNNDNIIYNNDNVIIYGDTTIDKDKIYYTSIKFEPYISFDDYKVSLVDNQSKAKLDFSSNKEAYNYRTKLREAYKSDTSNFAGHYTLVYWGCGSNCKSSMIIDRQTGKIYDSPSSSLGYEYYPDSRMLLVNPPDSNGFYDDCLYCKPEIHIFDEKTKTFREIKP